MKERKELSEGFKSSNNFTSFERNVWRSYK